MDQRLVERTVELARARGGFNAKAWRLALDSSPLWGHGRVEDTCNLLGHAAHQVTSLPLDRGYLGDKLLNTYDEAGVVIVYKPWPLRNPAGHFSKPGFQIDLVCATEPVYLAGKRWPYLDHASARRLTATAQCPPHDG